jgi:RNA polymerase sigma-70 factor (ECF subfamily)
MATPSNSGPDTRRLERLLHASAGRDQLAFAELYEATKAKLFATALLIVKRRDLAEEVVQEAYVRIWTRASTYDAALGSPVAWMAAIARNLAINIVRRPAFEVPSDDAILHDFPADDPSALDAIQSSQSEDRALRALQDLDPMKRRLIIAAYLHGESREQLAQRFGMPANTIKTWIRRSLLEIRSSLDADHRRTVA